MAQQPPPSRWPFSAIGGSTPTGGIAVAQLDSDGNLLIAGNITASNPSVGQSGNPIPSYSTLVGSEDGSGNLQAVSAANPLPVSGSFSASFAENTKDDTGTASSATVILTQADTTGYYSCFFQIGGIGTSTVVAEINNNGTWVATEVAPVVTGVGQATVTTDGMYMALTGGLGFRLRVSVYDGTATIAANALFRGFSISLPSQAIVPASQSGIWNITNISGTISLPTGASTSALQTSIGATAHTDAAAIVTALGSPFQAGGNIGNTSFAATQSGAWNIGNVTGTVSLPTGAATAAKQPALGTAGTPSADVISVQGEASMTPLVVDGGTASGSSVVNPPVTIGGRAATANPTAVADGQVVNTMHDKLGKLVAVGAIRTLKGTQKTSISNTTSETTIITQVASTFCDLYGLILANTGATTTKVDIRDTTGGAIIATIEVPTLETRGFMLPVDSAIPQTTVNTNWSAQCAAATTAMEITALWVRNT